MTLALGEAEEPTSLVLDDDEEPISGEVVTDSTVVIIHQEEPTTVGGEITLARKTMSLQGANGPYQIFNKL